MIEPIRQRVPLAASDAQVIVRLSAARHDRAMGAVGVLSAKPWHAGCGLIPLPRLSAYDRDDVTVVSEACELDLSGMAAAQAQLRDAWRQARLRSVADLAGLPVPGRAFLSVPVSSGRPIRGRAGNLAPGGPQPARGVASHRHADVVRGV
jgi:hypothetical protein